MKKDIHPECVETRATRTRGNSFTTHSTLTSGEMRVDVCSACRPFYTGKQRILGTAGRVNHFKARYAKYNAAGKATTEKKTVEVRKAANETTAAK